MLAIHITFSLLSYLIVWGLFMWKPEREFRLVLIMVWLIIKDITQYAVQFKPIPIRKFDLSWLNSLYQQKQVSLRYYLVFLNRVYFFPLILTLYLMYLLISQTQIWDLHLSLRYLMVQENFVLFLTIVSWLFLVVKEDKDKEFIRTETSIVAAYGYYIVSVVLGILSTYIIYEQVQNLWSIWTIIAIMAWVLVFLVWVLLMEEDEDHVDT